MILTWQEKKEITKRTISLKMTNEI